MGDYEKSRISSSFFPNVELCPFLADKGTVRYAPLGLLFKLTQKLIIVKRLGLGINNNNNNVSFYFLSDTDLQ